MITQRLVWGAALAFALAWGTLTMLAARRPSRLASPARDLSSDDVARHDTPEDCWIVVRGKVYDVTRYIASHPAPRRTITDHCGKESTRAFETKERDRPHSEHAWQLLEVYLVGEARD